MDSTGQPSWGADWQEEVYQKSDSLPQQQQTDQIEKLKVFKMMLERILSFLQVSKRNILPNHKEKLDSYEKQIMNFINANRRRKVVMPSLQPQGQLPPTHMQYSMPQPQPQPQPQVNPVQSCENRKNSHQLQTTNVQCS